MGNRSLLFVVSLLLFFVIPYYTIACSSAPAPRYDPQPSYVSPESCAERCKWAQNNYRQKSAALSAIIAGKTFSDYQSSQQKNVWNALAGVAAGATAKSVAESEVEVARQQMIQMCGCQ